jgi:lysosomal acid lipase/cholesteryl ester hydrolase
MYVLCCAMLCCAMLYVCLCVCMSCQGTTQAFAALSAASPELSGKISVFIALAPAVFPCGFRDSLVSSFFSSGNSEAIVSFVFGSGAMLRLTKVSQRILSKACFASAVRHSLHYLFSCQSNNISRDRQTEMFQHVYSPSSVQCVQHWLQIIRSGQLCRYSNSTRSSNSSGPGQVYDVSGITTPVALIHGASDELVDAESLIQQLKTCVMHKKIAKFEHLELVWADSAHIEIFPSILELLQAYKPLSARREEPAAKTH